MKSKVRVISILLVLLISAVLLSACGQAVPKDLQAPTVELAGVYPMDLGSGGFSYNQVFSITNPNPIMVVMDTLQYSTSVDYVTLLDEPKTGVLAKAQLLDDVYVPANTEVRVSSAFAVALGSVIGEAYMAGGADNIKYLPQSMQELIASGQMDAESASGMVSVGAIAAIFPLWKICGASRPPIDPNLDTYLEMVVWDGAAEGPPAFKCEGTATFTSAAGSVEVPFTTQWQAP